MKWKAVVLAGFALVAIGGVAQAAGVLGQSVPEERKEATIVEHAIAKAEGEVEADASRVRGARGPRGHRGSRGPQGPKGATGATGATGPKGTFGSITSYASGPVFLCGWEAGACSIGSSIALCPPGTTAISGGHSGAGLRVFSSTPYPGGWFIGAANENFEATTFKAFVVCAA